MGILKGDFGGESRNSLAHVTQTNDPMGILKGRIPFSAAVGRGGYTDQRSDGDTESSVYHKDSILYQKLHRPTIRWGY